MYSVTKRAMDIVGSAAGLLLLSPLFLAIAIAIKLTSKGPVFFRQQRVGQFGTPFVFLKFRSMYVNNDTKIHRDYVMNLISGKAERQPSNGNGKGHGVYKLTKDPRVTRVGAFLRKTSLDELPQLYNVLRGDMSLVGPRPAIPYEVRGVSTLAPTPRAGSEARYHRPVAGQRSQPRGVRRHGSARCPLCHRTILLA